MLCGVVGQPGLMVRRLPLIHEDQVHPPGPQRQRSEVQSQHLPPRAIPGVDRPPGRPPGLPGGGACTPSGSGAYSRAAAVGVSSSLAVSLGETPVVRRVSTPQPRPSGPEEAASGSW